MQPSQPPRYRRGGRQGLPAPRLAPLGVHHGPHARVHGRHGHLSARQTPPCVCVCVWSLGLPDVRSLSAVPCYTTRILSRRHSHRSGRCWQAARLEARLLRARAGRRRVGSARLSQSGWDHASKDETGSRREGQSSSRRCPRQERQRETEHVQSRGQRARLAGDGSSREGGTVNESPVRRIEGSSSPRVVIAIPPGPRRPPPLAPRRDPRGPCTERRKATPPPSAPAS